MATDIEICNLALDNLGVTNKITALNQQTKESLACNRWYSTIRDGVLATYPWPFATRYADLVEAVEANAAWGHLYTLPTDFLVARRLIVSASPNPPPFDVIVNAAGTGKVLGTDESTAKLEYTARIPESLLPATVVEAISWKLASALVQPLALKEELIVSCRRMYQMIVIESFTVESNGRQIQQPPDSEVITARE